MGLRVVTARNLERVRGHGFTVLSDEEVAFASKGDSKLPIPLRRIRVERDNANTLSLLTNHMTRSAVAIAARYKARWRIELLFRWIKQHLKFRKFLGHNENAIKLLIDAAVIADALLRLAARTHKLAHPILRFTDLVRKFRFERRHLAAIEKPPHVNPSRKQDKSSPDQLSLCYA
jgi:IS4 transposase